MNDASDALFTLVRECPFPAALVDLQEYRYVEVNVAAAALFAVDEPPVGERVTDFVRDPRATEARLTLLRDATVRWFETTWKVKRADGERANPVGWGLSVPGRESLALLAAVDDDAAPVGSIGDLLRPPAEEIVVGYLDENWRITRVTEDICDVVGFPARSWVGRGLLGEVHPADAGVLLSSASRALAGAAGVELEVRLWTQQHAWRRVRLGLLPFESDSPIPALIFTLTPSVRSTAVEQHHHRLRSALWRASAELEATGILPTAPAAVEESADDHLSSRQVEIVNRLLRGERVPTIARETFVSQSTVRSHLSAIFRKFGVHSQEELLRRVRADLDGPAR